MIEWKKVDKDNYPNGYVIFVDTWRLVYYGHYSFAYGSWYDQSANKISNVTHYAEINLPE